MTLAVAPNTNISTQTLDAISFVAVYPSKDCDMMQVINQSGQDCLVRSDPADANSELSLSDFSRFMDIAVNVRNSPKFRTTVPYAYMKLAGGAGVIKKLCW